MKAYFQPWNDDSDTAQRISLQKIYRDCSGAHLKLSVSAQLTIPYDRNSTHTKQSSAPYDVFSTPTPFQLCTFAMVYCGKPSKACGECRLRRTKVSLLPITASSRTDLWSATRRSQHAPNASEPVGRVRATEIQQILCFATKLKV